MSGNSALLLDTNILVWAGTGDNRLPAKVLALLTSSDEKLSLSAVTAWEYEDLRIRGRIPAELALAQAIDGLGLHVLDLPVACWQVAAALPPLHKDPIDRMLIAHAIVADETLVTSDAVVRQYPVECFW